MTYLVLKYLHVSCVVLSGFGFFLRGLWMLSESALFKQRWVRVVPHVVDTVLLGSAITMLVISAPVSYTHLDVYKRQLHNRSPDTPVWRRRR